MSKPLKLFASRGPNPWKVAIFLEELGLSYETEVYSDNNELKKPGFTKYSPNGRVPALLDPNHNDVVVWESGAIIEYLLDTYGADSSLNPTAFPDKYYAKQYLHFQMSGQGPYFGQAMWFMFYHPEKIATAQDRYIKEIRRVSAVLDDCLKRNGSGWLVGKECTYADLVFVPWFWMIPGKMNSHEAGLWESILKDNPDMAKWWAAMEARPAVVKAKDQWHKLFHG